MRVEQDAPCGNSIFVGQTLMRLPENESMFQVAVNVGKVVCQSSEDCFAVFGRIEHLMIEVPVPEFFLKEVVELTPFLFAEATYAEKSEFALSLELIVVIS